MRRSSSVRIVSVSASVVDAKTPHSSIVSWGAPSGESTVPEAPGPVRSDLMWDIRFPMWDMRLPFCMGVRQQSDAGPPGADQVSHDSAPAVVTMRGARRSHNTLARTADRQQRSAPAAIRMAAREPWDRLAQPGLGAPTHGLSRGRSTAWRPDHWPAPRRRGCGRRIRVARGLANALGHRRLAGAPRPRVEAVLVAHPRSTLSTPASGRTRGR